MILRSLPLQNNSRMKMNLGRAREEKFQGMNGDLLKQLLIKSFSKAWKRSSAEIMNNSEKPFNSIAKVSRSRLVNYLIDPAIWISLPPSFSLLKSMRRTEYWPDGNQTSKKFDFHQQLNWLNENSSSWSGDGNFLISFFRLHSKVAAEGTSHISRCKVASTIRWLFETQFSLLALNFDCTN